jgi:hypothetical protein
MHGVRGTGRLGKSVFERVVLLPRLYQLERSVDYHPVSQAASTSIDVGSCRCRVLFNPQQELPPKPQVSPIPPWGLRVRVRKQ